MCGFTVTDSMQDNIIRLLFKKTTAEERLYRKNYRPITLQNVEYKILFKVLARRVSRVIHKIVPFLQSAFVPGRSIGEVIMATRMIMHSARQKGTSMGILLLDMEKAYDSCDHEYIYAMLKAVGFPPGFVKWVEMSLSSSKMRLIINGFYSESFSMDGGGKQGDPLFPYVFLVVMMGLIALVEKDSNISGIHIPTLKHKLKIMQFADDTSMFIGQSSDFPHMIKNMGIFCLASGMVVNFAKTLLILYGKWRKRVPPEIAHPTIKMTHRILGIMLGSGRKSDTVTVTNGIEKVKRFIKMNNNIRCTINGYILYANASVNGILSFILRCIYI